MTVRHLPASSTPEAVAAVIAEDGCAVIDDLASAELLDRIDAEMAGYVDATPYGVDEFAGPHTRRTGGLVARSAAARELVLDDLVLGTCDRVLDHVQQYQLHLTQLIRIEPGGVAQMIHRDQWAFDFFTFPTGYQVQCNTIWAATDFTEANGATRVVPGEPPRRRQAAPRCRRHRAGRDGPRLRAPLRGLAVPRRRREHVGRGPRRASTSPTAWAGCARRRTSTSPCRRRSHASCPNDSNGCSVTRGGAYALGYVDDLRDPLDVLMGRAGTSPSFAPTISSAG